ncbi:MAG TPA: hypothetical protein VFP72_17785 [Kineosporiaceae bacterium]|nr:hypothetical protein [Kineosporiaceae bacterium]
MPGIRRTPTTTAWWTVPMESSDQAATAYLPPADPAAATTQMYSPPAGQGPGGRDGAPARDPEPSGGRRGLRPVWNTEGRRRAAVTLGIAGGIPLIAALAVVGLLPDPPRANPSATAGPGTTTSSTRPPGQATSPSTSMGTSAAPTDVSTVGSDQATADLGSAGVRDDGQIVGAYEWTDSRGRSLLAEVAQVDDQADGSPTQVSLRAYYVTGLGGQPTVQRRLRDPKLRCGEHGPVTAAFTDSAFTVRDLDGDGAPEVVVGWTSRCWDPTSSSRVRLAVMSGPKLYVLRGDGVVTGTAANQAGSGVPPGGPPGGHQGGNHQGGNQQGGNGQPGSGQNGNGRPGNGQNGPSSSPGGDQWPPGLLGAATAMFHGLYY